MSKKSLITGSVTLILLALLTLAGCPNPAGGSGPQGRDGTLVLASPVTAGELAAYFDDVHIIKLISDSATVDGIVPPGKTLQIAGSAAVTPGQTLTLTGGTVHILDTGALTSVAAAPLLWERGRLVIEGDLVLAAADDEFFAQGVPGWIGFGAAGAVDLQGAAAGVINANFGYGVPAIKADTSGLLTDLSAFPDWTGGRKLIAYGAQTTTTHVLDLTARGPLVIGRANRAGASAGSLTINQVTNQGAFLVSRGGGSLTVAENARLILTDNGWLPDNIPVTIYGSLSADGARVIAAIPPNVDLSRGTLTAEAGGTPAFTFGPRGVNIGRIEMPAAGGSITINGVPFRGGSVRQQVILNVGSILPNATPGAAALYLPAGTTTVDKIITGGTNQALTLGSSANGHAGDPVETVKTLLRPGIIAGSSNVEVIRGARLELRGPVDLSNTLILDSDNLGADWAGQLALITGGTVDTRGDHLVFSGGETLNTQLLNSGEVDLSGTVTFNRSAGFAKVTVTAPATVAGRGTFAITGSLLVNDDITFTIKGFGVDPGAALSSAAGSSITIADTKSIYLGPETWFVAGDGLILTEGQYLAAGNTAIAAAAGPSSTTITAPAEAAKGLTIRPAGDTTNTITLCSDGAASAVFTATAGGGAAVVFGKDGILIPADGTSGAVFTVSGTGTAVGEVTVSGTSAITLGASASPVLKGTLFLINGAKLTAADAATPYTYRAAHTDFAAPGDFDRALTPVLTGTAYGANGVFITTKAAGTIDAKFTSTTVGK
jgi:hypothetical protein